MSASENLKALEANYGWPPKGLREAFPQIMAVIEAVERAVDVAESAPRRMGPLLRREVAPALAALEEALK